MVIHDLDDLGVPPHHLRNLHYPIIIPSLSQYISIEILYPIFAA